MTQQINRPPKANMSRPAFAMPEATIPDPPTPEAPKPTDAPTRPAPRFTVHAMLDDFPFEVEFSGTADNLSATVKRLREIGAVPPSAQARAAEETAREAPRCNNSQCDHFGRPMKASTKQPGTHYCSGKIGFANGQPVYCKEKS